jgi:hypothetical protein
MHNSLKQEKKVLLYSQRKRRIRDENSSVCSSVCNVLFLLEIVVPSGTFSSVVKGRKKRDTVQKLFLWVSLQKSFELILSLEILFAPNSIDIMFVS